MEYMKKTNETQLGNIRQASKSVLGINLIILQ